MDASQRGFFGAKAPIGISADSADDVSFDLDFEEQFYDLGNVFLFERGEHQIQRVIMGTVVAASSRVYALGAGRDEHWLAE